MSMSPIASRDVAIASATHAEYTLADLLADRRLGLELAAGWPDATHLPILGAYTIELEHPSDVLDSGWMMLTTGARLRRKPDAQRELIAQLADLGASCLGFGVGPSFHKVPPALLDEAKKRRVPVVLIPARTALREVSETVFRATQSREATTFARLSSLQQNLLLALSDARPTESIVQRLGRLTHASVAVVSAAGEVLAATGPVPALETATEALNFDSLGATDLVVGEWHVVVAPVGDADRVALVVATRAVSSSSRDLVRAAVQVAVPVLGASRGLRAARIEQDRALQASLLDCALDDDLDASGQRALGARIAAAGGTLGPEARVMVLSAQGEDGGVACPHLAEEIGAWLRSKLDPDRRPHLLSTRGNYVALLMYEDRHIRDFCDDLLNSRPELAVIGVGRPVEHVKGIRLSYLDAQLAVRQLTARQAVGALRYDDLDLVTQLLAEAQAERFQAKAAETARLLIENPIQLEALRAYFAKNRDIKAAAESIYLHPNTLRYRLERLEQALGRSLQEPSVTASLYCVLEMMDTAALASDPSTVAKMSLSAGPCVLSSCRHETPREFSSALLHTRS